jgi:hypothetical protein
VETAVSMHVTVENHIENTEDSFSRGVGWDRRVGETPRPAAQMPEGPAQLAEAKYY